MKEGKSPSLVRWIRGGARIMAGCAFFAVLLVSLDHRDPFNVNIGTLAIVKGVLAGLLFWVLGYVLADLVFKGLVETVSVDEVPVYEGGLLQRVREEKFRSDPEVKAMAADVEEARKAGAPREKPGTKETPKPKKQGTSASG